MLEISSVFELRGYSRPQLLEQLHCTEADGQALISILQQEGILKQRQRSPVLPNSEESTASSSPAGVGDYYFDFVGVVEIAGHLIKCNPKLLSCDPSPALFRTILKSIERFNAKYTPFDSTVSTNGYSNLNILSLALYILRVFSTHGLYTTVRDRHEFCGDGEIDWEKTIDEVLPVVQKSRPCYVEYWTNQREEESTSLVTTIHKRVLNQCSQQLKDSGLTDIFSVELPFFPEANQLQFKSTVFLLYALRAELSQQFITWKRELLNALIAFIQDGRLSNTTRSLQLLGTTSFNLVWQDALSQTLGDMKSLQLKKLPICLHSTYKARENEELCDLIPRLQWTIPAYGTPFTAGGSLLPDFLSLVQYNHKNHFVILDAKYYAPIIIGQSVTGMPGVSDVNKQHLYELAFSSFIAAHHLTTVNAFLLPSSGDTISCIGFVEAQIVPSATPIALIYLPLQMVLSNYVTNNRIPITDILDCIAQCKCTSAPLAPTAGSSPALHTSSSAGS